MITNKEDVVAALRFALEHLAPEPRVAPEQTPEDRAAALKRAEEKRARKAAKRAEWPASSWSGYRR